MSFRDEVFKLCKVIQEDSNTKLISNLIHDLSTIKNIEEIKVGEKVNLDRSYFNQLAKSSYSQFYGYLYLNEHTQDYKPNFFQTLPLSTDEILLISRAHATIVDLIEGCLYEFKRDFPKIYSAINPYSKYKAIKKNKEESLIESYNYEKTILEFKSSTLYQKLYKSNLNVFLEDLSTEKINKMLNLLEEEMNKCPLDKIPESIEKLLSCLHTDYKALADIYVAEIVLILGLRKSL